MDDDTTIRTFDIATPQAELDDLRERLARTRRPQPLPDDSRALGVPQADLDRFVDAWLDFDWQGVERRLGDLDHVVTTVDGQRVHAVHARSPFEDATPIVLLHGWPGGFLEHVGLIERLTRPDLHGGDAEDAFHVVIPSLPGFGWSTPLAQRADLTMPGIAGMMLELMRRLGYESLVALGGDVGGSVAPEMGRLAPDRVRGVYVCGTLGAFVTSDEAATMHGLTDVELDRAHRVDRFLQDEMAYVALQSTRPALLGAMLADSPVAQLAWHLDKLHAWTWPIEQPADEVLGMDAVLANVTLAWLTRSAGTSAYVGYALDTAWGEPAAPSGVPTAALQLAHDVGIRAAAEREHRIVRWTDVDRGGHFAALEEPELLVADLRAFTRSL